MISSCEKQNSEASGSKDGKSAYELAVENGYTGTVEEWLISLVGEVGAAGQNGADGANGKDGTDGKSAYELACDNGYKGTLAEWIASLVGAKGEDGTDGKSAYEMYCESNPDYTGTEAEWLFALVNGELALNKEHTVTFDLGYDGKCFTQKVKSGNKVSRPDTPKREGYVFKEWAYSDGEYNEAWSFIGYVVTSDITLTAKWDYATYELPIVNIDTSGAAINSKEDYTDMVFSVENCDDELTDISGGIRLRGNSTMNKPKKPYRIKFDKKQSLFGLDKAKSWVLLADYLDPSALHNYTAFSLGNEMEGFNFTPTPNKVNVYLNGNYIGLYTLCEQVQENEGRMNIELDEITDSMVDIKDYNFFICMDYSCISDAGAKEDETYFYIEEYDKYFEIKYPEKDQFTSEEQFKSFVSQLKVYVKETMDTFAEKDINKIREEVNVNSLADFLIVDQIMGEQDHCYKSFNMYFTNTSDNPEENGKLNFGPIWDYDWALYTPFTGLPNTNYKISDAVNYSNLFFKTMASVPELYEVVKERYNQYAKPALEDYIENFEELHNSMKVSLQINHELWYKDFPEDMTDKNIKFLKDFLIARKNRLDLLWAMD